MRTCQRCQSSRILSVLGHCCDRFSAVGNPKDDIHVAYSGYVLDDIGIGGRGGDDIHFKYCLDCGQIQGQFPVIAGSLIDELE